MFILPADEGERIEQALARRVCTAPDGSYIMRSYGRVRAGRPARYTVHLVNGVTFAVRARNDEEAVALANKRAAQQAAVPDAPQAHR